MAGPCIAQAYSIVLAYQEETTFKQSPGVPNTKQLFVRSEGIQLNQPLFSSEVIRNDRNPLSPSRGNFEIAGSVETEMSPYIASLVKYSLGTVTTTPVGAAFQHVIKIGGLPSFLLEKGFTDVAAYGNKGFFLYNGCKVNSFAMTFANEGIVTCSFDVMGCKETTSTTSYDATPSAVSHDPFDMFECAIEEGGAPIAIVSECAFTLENNLDGSIYVIGGQGERECLPAGLAKLTGTLNVLYRDDVLYDKAYNFTETTLKLTFTKGLGDGTAGNEKMEILIPELKYAAQSPAVEGQGGVMLPLTFEAFYDNSAEASAMQVTFWNTEAAI